MSNLITPAMARRIELWPIDRLVPYAKNARTHSPEQVAQIAASIVQFGFNNPVLVDSADGIIAGHGRLLAARKLGLAEVPVVVLDHLSETQRRAYIIADNKLAENAGWDEAVLAEELRGIADDGLDLALVGFPEEELEALLADDEDQDGAPEEEAEEIPVAPVQPVTAPGDVWMIGRHKLICGDCRDPQVVRRLFDGVAAQMAITSPPYASQREYDPASGFKGDVALWAEWLTANGVLRRGAKKLLQSARVEREAGVDYLDQIFEPAALDSLMGAWDGDWRDLLKWWRERLNAEGIRRAEFPIAVAQRAGSRALAEPPRVIVGTIHSVKGGEADVVYLFPDLSVAGDAQYHRMGAPRDSVIRLFYVGITRARHTLYIAQQCGPRAICL